MNTLARNLVQVTLEPIHLVWVCRQSPSNHEQCKKNLTQRNFNESSPSRPTFLHVKPGALREVLYQAWGDDVERTAAHLLAMFQASALESRHELVCAAGEIDNRVVGLREGLQAQCDVFQQVRLSEVPAVGCVPVTKKNCYYTIMIIFLMLL